MQPSVIKWFRVYVGFMVGLYLLVVGIGGLCLVFPEAVADYYSSSGTPMPESVSRLMGGFYLALGLVFVVGYAIPLRAPRRGWVWIYGLVLIAIGMMSCCLWPATIPLLIHWIKPECRAWYQDGGSG